MASDQGKTAILFIHGILGTTKHFETFFRLFLQTGQYVICR